MTIRPGFVKLIGNSGDSRESSEKIISAEISQGVSAVFVSFRVGRKGRLKTRFRLPSFTRDFHNLQKLL